MESSISQAHDQRKGFGESHANTLMINMFVPPKRTQTFKALPFSHHKFYQMSTARMSWVAFAQPVTAQPNRKESKAAQQLPSRMQKTIENNKPPISDVTFQLIRKLARKDKVLKT